jgi:hypothetical protein
VVHHRILVATKVGVEDTVGLALSVGGVEHRVATLAAPQDVGAVGTEDHVTAAVAVDDVVAPAAVQVVVAGAAADQVAVALADAVVRHRR